MKMKKGKIASLLAGLIITGLLLFSACSNILSPSAANTGQGNVRVSLSAGPSGRTLMPSALDFDEYDFLFSNTTTAYSHTFNVVKGGSLTFNVPVGSGYSLHVTAYKGTGGSRVVAAEGGSAGTFAVSALTSVTVQLAGKLSEGEPGTFSYNIQYPAGAHIERFVLISSNGEANVEMDLLDGVVETDLGPAGKAMVCAKDMAAGWYGLELDLADGTGKVAYDDDIVVIYSDTTTFYGKADTPVVYTTGDFKAPDISDLNEKLVQRWPGDNGFQVAGNDFGAPSYAVGTRFETLKFFQGDGKAWNDVLKLEPPEGGYKEGTMAFTYPLKAGEYSISMKVWMDGNGYIFWQDINDWSRRFFGDYEYQPKTSGQWYDYSSSFYLDSDTVIGLLANGTTGQGLFSATVYIRDFELVRLGDETVLLKSTANDEGIELDPLVISPSKLSIVQGDTATLTASKAAVWSVEPAGIVSVNASGDKLSAVITTISRGSAVIKAASIDDPDDYKTVPVAVVPLGESVARWPGTDGFQVGADDCGLPSYAVGTRYDTLDFIEGDGKTWNDVLKLEPPENGYPYETMAFTHALDAGSYYLSMRIWIDGRAQIKWQVTSGSWPTILGGEDWKTGGWYDISNAFTLDSDAVIGLLAWGTGNQGLIDKTIYIRDLELIRLSDNAVLMKSGVNVESVDLTVTPSGVTLLPGDTRTLTANKPVFWSVEPAGIVSVSGSGDNLSAVVTGISAGQAVIKAAFIDDPNNYKTVQVNVISIEDRIVSWPGENGFHISGYDYTSDRNEFSNAVGTEFKTLQFNNGDGRTWNDVLMLEPPPGGYPYETMALTYPLEAGYYYLSMKVWVDGNAQIIWHETSTWRTLAGGVDYLSGGWYDINGVFSLDQSNIIGLLASGTGGKGLLDATIYIRDIELVNLNDNEIIMKSEANTELTVSPSSVMLIQGDTQTLAANYAVNWSVDPAGIVSVAGSGDNLSAVVTGMSAGSALIKATSTSNQNDYKTIPVTVLAQDDGTKKYIAITFDDGPGPYTEAFLNVLEEHNAHGTFFCIGPNVENYPALAKEMIRRGHEIGNHSTLHEADNWWGKPFNYVLNDFLNAQIKITNITGVAPKLMRAPSLGYPDYMYPADINDYSVELQYGSDREEVARILGLPLIDATRHLEGTWDWNPYYDSGKAVYDEFIRLNLDKEWGILLFHDNTSNSQNTLAALPDILNYLIKEKGYTVVTVSEMAARRNAGRDLEPGRIYYDFVDIPVHVENITVYQGGSVVQGDAISLALGGTAILNAVIGPAAAASETVYWYSDNNNVATVSDSGIVTAIGKGTALIRAVSGGMRKIITVTVGEGG